MKKLYSIILASITLFGWSCSGSSIVEDVMPITTQVKAQGVSNESDSLVVFASFEEDRALLSECGYDTSDMVEYDEYYTVGAEFIFFKSTLAECRKNKTTKIRI